MRILAILLVFICGIVISFSQENQNILQDEKTTCAIFVSGVFSVSELMGQMGYADGLEIGVNLEEKLIVSLRVQTFGTKPNIDNFLIFNSVPFLETNYAGLNVAYNFLKYDNFHLSAGSLIGFGSSYYTINFKNTQSNESINSQQYKDDFFVIEPAIAVNSSILKDWLRAEFRLFYRICSGYNLPQSKSSDLNGVGSSFSISIGSF